MMPIEVSNVTNITFTVDGIIVLSEDNEKWPAKPKNDHENIVYDFWHIYDSEHIHIRGSGKIEGQGYWWWMREYIVANKNGRPHMLRMERVRHAIIEGVNWYNSPKYHIYITDIDDFIL